MVNLRALALRQRGLNLVDGLGRVPNAVRHIMCTHVQHTSGNFAAPRRACLWRKGFGLALGEVQLVARQRQPDSPQAGVDLNQDAVQMARRIIIPGIANACAHGAQLPFPGKSFDMVIMSEVLEHIPAPEFVLEEALRLSRAYLLVTVPLEPYFQSVSDLLVRLKLGHSPEHVNFWTAGGFKCWLNRQVSVARYGRCDLYQLALCRPPI
jgi:SAM-dependent methyltransferase